MGKARRVGIYTRVSTGEQTTANQERELRAWAERAGHEVVKVYEDHGISGSKGRDQRPQFDALLKAAVRREIDMIAVWASDRLGRSLRHLVEVLETIRDTGTGLYVHTQALDTTTPAGRAMFQLLGVFSEFEKEMIVSRVKAGVSRVKEELAAKGSFVARKSGIMRSRLGRPMVEESTKRPEKAEAAKAARAMLAEGTGILKVAKATGLGTGTVARIAKEQRAA
jgi:DNA invertase Pin-like site-specific DNA recombinase